ncbi:MAG: hypothetical protein VYA34_13580 [Myxococcota bacterium]|nr:hypothetical protein [Myxococcota bacterium]
MKQPQLSRSGFLEQCGNEVTLQCQKFSHAILHTPEAPVNRYLERETLNIRKAPIAFIDVEGIPSNSGKDLDASRPPRHAKAAAVLGQKPSVSKALIYSAISELAKCQFRSTGRHLPESSL